MEISNKVIEDIVDSIVSVLGTNLTEETYHNAFELELSLRNIPFQTKVDVPVKYKDCYVGSLQADIVIPKSLIVELKAVSERTGTDKFVNQTRLYMKLLEIKKGVVINFWQLPNIVWVD